MNTKAVKITGTGSGDLGDQASSTLIIESGEPVTVFGFIISAGTNNNIVEMRKGDGSTALTEFVLLNGNNLVSNIEFVASDGISFTATSGTNTRVVVFHSHPGA